MAIPIAARRKVMNAAAEVDTSGPREAAILGGVCRSMIEHGNMRPDVVRWWMAAILQHFRLVNVDCRPPCNAELAMVLQRFEEAFGSRVA